MPDGQSLLAAVSDLVVRLDHDTLEPGYVTQIRRGSAKGTVSVILSPVHQTRILLVSLEIMRAPAEPNSVFLTRLLELNRALLGRAAFSLQQGVVHLQAGRPIDELGPGELVDLIVWTADEADRVDDLLLDEFGREYTLG